MSDPGRPLIYIENQIDVFLVVLTEFKYRIVSFKSWLFLFKSTFSTFTFFLVDTYNLQIPSQRHTKLSSLRQFSTSMGRQILNYDFNYKP